jgi:DNA replication protein DnaC
MTTALRTLGRQLMWSAASLDQITGQGEPAQIEFLVGAMETELAHRDRSRKARFRKRAGFPVVKGFDGYDWTHVTLPQKLTRDQITSCEFITEKQNLVLFGPVGTGKTHLATAIGQAACEQSIPVRFHTCSDLVVRLAEAKTTGTLDRTMKDILKAQLIILDLCRPWDYADLAGERDC